MTSRPAKVRAGISFDQQVIMTLDKYVATLSALAINRSEIVNAILSDYFDGNGSHEALQATVAQKRSRESRWQVA